MDFKINPFFSLFLLILTFITILFFLIFGLFSFISAIRGAPYLASRREKVREMIKIADIKPGEKAADLGSGDGRIVIALARAGAEAHGYEINPFLVWWARRNIGKAGLKGRAFSHWGDFWRVDFSSFDVIIVYCLRRTMKGLEKKLKEELEPGARVVSNYFTFPDWPASKKENNVHLYHQSKTG